MIHTGSMKFSNLTIHFTLGRGGTGLVSYATDSSGNEYAFKGLNCPKDSHAASMLEREARKLKEMKHPCIITRHDLVENDQNEYVGLLLEYMPGGNILDAKDRFQKETQKDFTEPLKIRMMFDIAKGMRHLHNNEICHVHHDIKAQNCLLDKDLHAKICDLETIKGEQTTTIMGVPRATLSHAAPECLRDATKAHRCLPEMDIYSFGIFMFEVMSIDDVPYSEQKNIPLFTHHVLNGGRPDTSKLQNTKLVELMKRCWDDKPEARPKADEVCKILQEIYEPLKDEADKQAAELGHFALMKRRSRPPVVLDENLARDDNNPRYVTAAEAETVLNLENNGIFLKDKTKAVDADIANLVGSTIGPKDFRPVGRCLLFTENDLDTIDHDVTRKTNSIAEVNIDMLNKWMEKYAERATHEWLATACLSMARPDLLRLFPQNPRPVKVQ